MRIDALEHERMSDALQSSLFHILLVVIMIVCLSSKKQGKGKLVFIGFIASVPKSSMHMNTDCHVSCDCQQSYFE